MFKEGDIVRIKPEWLEQGEDPTRLYVIENVNNYTNRCYITELYPELPFPGSNLVGFEMIEKI